MINLTPEDVRLKAIARSKEDAIRQAGELLVARGRIPTWATALPFPTGSRPSAT